MTNLLIDSSFLEVIKTQGKNYTQAQILSAFEGFLEILTTNTNSFPDEKTRIRELMHSQSIIAGYPKFGILFFISKKNALFVGVQK